MGSSTTAGLLGGAEGAARGTGSHYDINSDIGLELGDVRVLVMQEATSSFSASTLMCDSHALADSMPPSPTLGGPPGRYHRGSISGRRTSLTGQATTKPVVIQDGHGNTNAGNLPRGAFDRRPSTHGRSNSIHETEQQRCMREYREDINTIANCMFGASDVMAYKGTGVKLHILQPEYRPHTTNYGEGRDGWEGRQSIGRGSLRRSGLAQSFTSESVNSSSTSAAGRQTSERKRVLLTRIFPVQLPADEGESPDGDRLGTSYPFPKSGTGEEQPKKSTPKQKRTPMYSIGLIIQLPATSQTSRSAYRASMNPGSYTESDSISSSFNSTKPTNWSLYRPSSGFGMDSLESSFSYDGDEKFDVILQHYDIIIRTMNRLQAEVTAELLKLLRQVDMASPDPMSLGRVGSHHRSASISVSGKRVDEAKKPVKPIRTNIKFVQLMPYALSNNAKVRHEVEGARQRVLGGINNLQVVTRQGRWGIWRDEARWVAKWAGGKEQGFFFYNLLTAFLGTHTEWLEAIGPTEYRRKHYKRNRPTLSGEGKEDRAGVFSRTVILSRDKMATRRLIFLLSAFLPNNQQGHNSPIHRERSGRSVSGIVGGYSQSPPSIIGSHKEESLLKKMNKGSVGKAANANHPRHLSFPAQLPRPNIRPDLVDREAGSRRASDAHVLPPTLPALPTASSNLSIASSRTNSPATTSTSTPVTTLPHFSTAQRRPIKGTGPSPRPGSSGSLATDDLIRSLKRGEAAGGAPKWQNMLGGLWNIGGRKGSVSNGSGAPGGGLGVPGRAGDGRSGRRERDLYGRSPKNKSVLEEMAEGAKKLNLDSTSKSKTSAAGTTTKIEESKDGSSTKTGTSEHSAPQAMKPSAASHATKPADNTPPSYAPVGSRDSPVKTSVDANGTINVDFRLPSFLTTTFQQPPPDFHEFNKMAPSSVSSSGILSSVGGSMSEIDSFEQYTRNGSSDDGASTNVAGWLSTWHPDFVLQGNPSCITDVKLLELEVRAAMAAEPTPLLYIDKDGKGPDGGPLAGEEVERWVTVASSIVANTSEWTIKRITLKRLVRVMHKEGAYQPVTPSVTTPSTAASAARAGKAEQIAGSFESRSGMSIYGNPYADSGSPAFPSSSTMRQSGGINDEGQEVVGEKWEEEMCISFDSQLIDAVEKVLERPGEVAETPTPVVEDAKTPSVIKTVIAAPKSGESSRQTSRPASRPESIHGRRKVEEVVSEVPRGEVRAVLLGALESLARKVAEEREKTKEDGGGRRDVYESGSVLREGVEGWLDEVDT